MVMYHTRGANQILLQRTQNPSLSSMCDQRSLSETMSLWKILKMSSLERRRNLDDKQQEIEEIKKELKALDFKLESTATSASKHLQSVNDELKVAFEDKLNSVKDKEEQAIRFD